METKRASQDPPEGRASWVRVPGLVEEIDQPEEGEVFHRVITAERYEDGSLKVSIAGRMLYGSKGATTSASIDADFSNDPDGEALSDILGRIEERYTRQLTRRLHRDAVIATAAAVREGEESEEDN
jgi:hypothetical protein